MTNLIIGQSGSGKTVLIEKISWDCWNPPTERFCTTDAISCRSARGIKWWCAWDGNDFSRGAALFDSLTVLENVRFPLDMFSDMTYGELDETLLRNVWTAEPLRCARQISGRFRAVCKSVWQQPRHCAESTKYLFCDEPNSGTWARRRIVIDELLSGITREFGMTTIINTHV